MTEPTDVRGGTAPSRADAAPEGARGHAHDLFGRGMLFVVIWSMQLVVATLVSPILAHVLPIDQFGALAAAIALYQLLILVSVFGLDQALEMQRVEDRDDRHARGLLATGAVVAFAVAGLMAATAPLWATLLGFGGSDGLVTVTLLWTAPGAAVLMALSLLQAEDRLARFAVVSLLSTVGSQVMGIVLLLTVERSALTYAWGGVIGQFSALAIGLTWTRPRWRGVLDWPVTSRALALGTPLVLAGLSEFVLNAGDRFLIQRWMGQEQVARYQVAFTVGNVMALLLVFTNRAWLPRLKSIVDPEHRWRAIAGSRDGTYWLVGCSLLGVTIGAPALLRIFAPATYQQDSLTLVVFLIALGAVPLAASTATSRMLITIRWSAPLAWGAALAVVVKVVTTSALLTWLGLPGAALGTLAGLAAQAWWLRRAVAVRHHPVPSDRSSTAFLVGVCALAGLSVLLPQTPMWNVGRFFAGAACVVPMLVCLRALREERIQFRRRGERLRGA